MISRIRNNKFSYLILIALLMAGLFYFKGYFTSVKDIKPLKPSQLDFSQSNDLSHKFHENFNAAPTASSDSSISRQNLATDLQLSEKETIAWKTLDEILKSKNDNDPRLDSELSHLSKDFHKALYDKYNSLKAEARNERGTLVFLIARDLKDVGDVDFLQSIYQESPCLNMANCSASTEVDPQDTGAQQTSLNYPQVAGLYQVERQLGSRPELLKDPSFRAALYNLLKTAENFPAPQVHQKAQQIREKYGL